MLGGIGEEGPARFVWAVASKTMHSIQVGEANAHETDASLRSPAHHGSVNLIAMSLVGDQQAVRIIVEDAKALAECASRHFHAHSLSLPYYLKLDG
jgi:hypothetical protein